MPRPNIVLPNGAQSGAIMTPIQNIPAPLVTPVGFGLQGPDGVPQLVIVGGITPLLHMATHLAAGMLAGYDCHCATPDHDGLLTDEDRKRIAKDASLLAQDIFNECQPKPAEELTSDQPSDA